MTFLLRGGNGGGVDGVSIEREDRSGLSTELLGADNEAKRDIFEFEVSGEFLAGWLGTQALGTARHLLGMTAALRL